MHRSLVDGVLRTVLDNGLTVLTRELRSSPTVSSMVWYRVGSRNEPKGQTGLSHLLEHMLFKGTERFPKGEIDRITLRNGGSNNAFTSSDFTAYYFSFASDRWHIALDIESDRMVNAQFDPNEFDAEKNVVIEELKSGLDSPWGLMSQELDASAFTVHPYRNPVVGWLPDVEAATVPTQERYYREHYCPSNAILVIVGDIDPAETLQAVRQRFGQLPPGRGPASNGLPPEPPQTEERRFSRSWRSSIPRLAIGYHTPAVGHPDTYPLQVASLVLSEGKTSRFYQRLVERDHLANSVSTDVGETLDPRLFQIRAEGRPESSHAAIEAAIFEELQRLTDDGPTAEELARAKRMLEATFVFSQERALDQATMLGQAEVLSGLDYLEQYLRRIHDVTCASVQEACQKYLSVHNRTVGWLVPDPAAQGDEDELLDREADAE